MLCDAWHWVHYILVAKISGILSAAWSGEIYIAVAVAGGGDGVQWHLYIPLHPLINLPHLLRGTPPVKNSVAGPHIPATFLDLLIIFISPPFSFSSPLPLSRFPWYPFFSRGINQTDNLPLQVEGFLLYHNQPYPVPVPHPHNLLLIKWTKEQNRGWKINSQ